MFELTVQFNIEKIGKWTEIWTKLWIKWNFKLTVFELGGPNLYFQELKSYFQELTYHSSALVKNKKNKNKSPSQGWVWN